jgi:hypothetical protein
MPLLCQLKNLDPPSSPHPTSQARHHVVSLLAMATVARFLLQDRRHTLAKGRRLHGQPQRLAWPCRSCGPLCAQPRFFDPALCFRHHHPPTTHPQKRVRSHKVESTARLSSLRWCWNAGAVCGCGRGCVSSALCKFARALAKDRPQFLSKRHQISKVKSRPFAVEFPMTHRLKNLNDVNHTCGSQRER